MPKLTKRLIDGITPADTDRLYFDDEMPRFGLRVMARRLKADDIPAPAVKSYLIQYRKDGRTRRLTFGKHGPLTPDQARDQARQLLAAVDRGHDPSQERHDRRAAPTMEELGKRFLAEHVAHRCKPTTQGEYRRSVELFINPKLGTMKAFDVQRKHVADMHLGLRDIPYQANRTLGVLRKMLNLAEVWGIRPDSSNPCRHIAKYNEEKRERFLSLDELARLGNVLTNADATDSANSPAVAAFRLLLLTGCRLREIQTLKWDYIQGNIVALPNSKTGAKRIILGQAAVDLITSIPRIDGNPYVITGKLEKSHLTDLEKPWRRLRKSAGLEDVRIHDLRHSFASTAVGIGETLPMIGKLLGHSQVQTTARYAHLAHDPVQSSANRISEIIARDLFKVSPASGLVNDDHVTVV